MRGRVQVRLTAPPSLLWFRAVSLMDTVLGSFYVQHDVMIAK